MTRAHIERGVWFVFVVSAIAFTPYIPPLKQFSDDLVAHPQPYLGIAIAVTVVGMGVFIAAGMVTAFRSGRRLTDAEAKSYASAPLRVPNYSFYRGYFRGKAVGQQVENRNGFQQIKGAFRNGDWLRNAEWRRFLLSFAAGLLCVSGGFGIAFVLGPPAVKLIVGVTIIYVVMRVGRAFWRA